MLSLLRRSRAIFALALAAGAGLVGLGCSGDDAIHTYRVPKSTERSGPPLSGDYRLLGGMFPADNPVWFFKFSGPEPEVTKYEADFDRMMESVSLGGAKPDFVPPLRWKRGPGRGGVVVETILPPEGKLEVTVTSSEGGVEGNLDRWVKMIGLKPSPVDESKYTRPIEGSGVKGLRVDLRGPKDPATARGMMMPR